MSAISSPPPPRPTTFSSTQRTALAPGRLACSALLVLACAGVATGAENVAGQTAPRHELFFELSAEVRSRRFDADVDASARLEMAVVAAPDGTSSLSLVRTLQPALKYYRIDALGPFGDEAKLAAIATLPEGSWDALDAARREVDRLGEEAHRRRTGGAAGVQPFDGAYTFVVIGSPRDRFRVRRAPDGRLVEVENRLTDRWLPGPFDAFVGRWGPGVNAAGPEGYWFWNTGETDPFVYEPHVYHALEGALGLLRQPLPDAAGPLEWPTLTSELVEILRTLFPKAADRLDPEHDRSTRLELVAPGSAGTPAGGELDAVLRRTRTGSSFEADWRADGLHLTLRVGERELDAPGTGSGLGSAHHE